MACSIPHSDDEIQALVQKQIDEDMVHQKAILDLALQFDNACTTKEDLRKAYEKCNHIPQESRALIDTFLKEGSDKDYELNLSMYRKAAKLEKQMNANVFSNALGDLNVTLKYLLGTVPGTIHYKVLDVGSYQKDIIVGAAMILANVLVFTPKPSKHYLNITKRNVVGVFRKDTVSLA
ncbi:RNA-directed DNA polymerase, eukaryota [Tanacetum coccineum]